MHSGKTQTDQTTIQFGQYAIAPHPYLQETNDRNDDEFSQFINASMHPPKELRNGIKNHFIYFFLFLFRMSFVERNRLHLLNDQASVTMSFKPETNTWNMIFFPFRLLVSQDAILSNLEAHHHPSRLAIQGIIGKGRLFKIFFHKLVEMSYEWSYLSWPQKNTT